MATSSRSSHTTSSKNVKGTRVSLKSPGGDEILVSIGPSGRTTIRAANVSDLAPRAVTIRGMTHAQATSKKKGFWGRLWDGIKKAVSAVIDAVTFDVGGATCRPSVSVGTSNGRITSVVVGVSCIN